MTFKGSEGFTDFEFGFLILVIGLKREFFGVF
jgi:hypothetical protein